MLEKEKRCIPYSRWNEDLPSKLIGSDAKDIIFSMCHALEKE